LSQLEGWEHISRLFWVSYKVDKTVPVCIEPVTRLNKHFPFALSQLQGWWKISYFRV
jgi:hypothetical protein